MQCGSRVLVGAKHCGNCGRPAALEEVWVALTSGYGLIVDKFVDESGIDQEQQVRALTVVSDDGPHQEPAPVRVFLTAGIEKAIDEGRLVRVPEPTLEAASAVSAPTKAPSSSLSGDWRRDLVHAFGLGGGPAVRQMQDSVAPDSVLGLAAIDEGARLPRDPRTSLPRESATDERKW